MIRSQAAVSGLQDCLALEHEAIWVYAYLGARIPGADEAARRAFGNHRQSRDVLIAMLRASASAQPAPRADYDVMKVKTLGQANAVAASLEAKNAAAYLSLVGASEDEDRKFAIDTLRRAALAILVWGGKPSAFPGLPA
ncbi:MAG: ferritin-like domain-containing protein [Kineosporiaceae bacterium]|nr:ferritin-like domain-containing protein [Aeromicrobium sp.]